MQWFKEFLKSRHQNRGKINLVSQLAPTSLCKEIAQYHLGPILTEGPVEFVIVAVTSTTPLDTDSQLSLVSQLAIAGGWHIQNLVSNVIVLTDGTLPIAKASVDRYALAVQLVLKLQTKVKIVHGTRIAAFGTYGDHRRVHGVLLSCYLEAMAKLHALEYGSSLELI